MVITGQNDHLVAMHSDVADGYVILRSILRGNSGLDRGNDLQVCVKEDQRVVSSFVLSDSTLLEPA